MGTKKVGLFVVALVVLVGAGLYWSGAKKGSVPTLHFCTWSNYYPDSFIEEFTKATGIPVELSYISSNEELFAKMKAGATGFDLIQPSDYLVAQLSKLEMLQPLDFGQLSNASHIDPFFTKLPYDPQMKFSVPFTWGTTGIAVNTEKVKLPEGEIGWDLLFNSPDPKHTSLLDDMREVFSGVLMWHGKGINETDPKLLEKTKRELAQIKSKVLLFSSEPRALLERGDVNIAHIFSFDGVGAAKANPKFRFLIPKEGATIYTDNFSIPKDSKNVAAAHRFINFFLDPSVGGRMALENGLATPNKTVRAALPPSVTGDPAVYPPDAVMRRLFFMDDIGESLTLISRLWTELKST